MLLKVCGATATSDLDLLESAGVDLIGLWWRVRNGRHSMTTDLVVDLVEQCRRRATVEPVIVTLSNDVGELELVKDRLDRVTVQLHAYQPPRVVSELRSVLPGSRIVKVLHVDDDGCVERRFIGAYERAGADAFLVDRTSAGHVGSTGRSVEPDAISALLDRSTLPFFVAGGLGDIVPRAFESILSSGRVIGIDIDSRARDHRGRLDALRIARVRKAWATGPTEWSDGRAERGGLVGARP
jgi:phosphoribosylanthranilate isomerase